MDWRRNLHMPFLIVVAFSGAFLYGSAPAYQKVIKKTPEAAQEVLEEDLDDVPKNAHTDSSDNDSKNGDEKDDENVLPKKEELICAPGDSEFKFTVRLRLPEFFYGKNLRLLNDDNPTDRVLFFRHVADFILQYRYGKPKVPYDIVYAKMTVRNKGVWGDPESIASTTSFPVNEFGTSFANHSHGIPLHLLWIRELWIQFSLNDMLRLPFCNNHTLTLGAFPFVLGRGIALGPAFAVDASDLGFISEYAIDQYAFGGKLSGELVKDKLFYDLYGGNPR